MGWLRAFGLSAGAVALVTIVADLLGLSASLRVLLQVCAGAAASGLAYRFGWIKRKREEGFRHLEPSRPPRSD